MKNISEESSVLLFIIHFRQIDGLGLQGRHNSILPHTPWDDVHLSLIRSTTDSTTSLQEGGLILDLGRQKEMNAYICWGAVIVGSEVGCIAVVVGLKEIEAAGRSEELCEEFSGVQSNAEADHFNIFDLGPPRQGAVYGRATPEEYWASLCLLNRKRKD